MTKYRLIPLIAAALAGLTLAVFAAGCGSSKTAIGANDVATVGNHTITKERFDALVAQACASYKAQKRPCPTPGTRGYATFRDSAMKYLIRLAEFEQKASDLNINVTDQDVDKRLQMVKTQYFGQGGKCDAKCEQKYQKQLKIQNLTEAKVRADIRASVVQNKLYEKVTHDISVSDKEINDYYKKNQRQYVQPASRDVRHILVKTKALADQVYQQLKHGANFAQLAKKYSQDPGTKNSGGKLTIQKGRQVPQFDNVAFSLKTRELSQPVRSQYGWHIIQALTPVKKAQATPISQVRQAIRQQLLQQKKQQAMSKWVNDLQKGFESKTTYQVGYAPPPTTTGAATTK
jgi:parvulin-like peptidyl-prolyl isomerase